MTDDLQEEEKEVEAPVPGAIVAGAEAEIEVPHDEFDALFPTEDSLEEEESGAYKPPHDDDEGDDYPFSGDEE